MAALRLLAAARTIKGSSRTSKTISDNRVICLPSLETFGPRRSFSASHSSEAVSCKTLNEAPPGKHYRVVIAGGGAGGLAVAAKLQRALKDAQMVAVVEPSNEHYYQPLFTLVGGGVSKIQDCVKPMRSLIPQNVEWYQTSVSKFLCEENAVVLQNGQQLKYDVLVVALGIETAWTEIKGFKSAVENGAVATIYGHEHCEKTWDNIRAFTKGVALFTMPVKPIKCPGAPQKIMFLAEDYWRKQGVRSNITVKWVSGIGKQFAVPVYADSLCRLCDSRGIERQYHKNLTEICCGGKMQAVFENLSPEASKEDKITENFDFLHVGPPHCPPEVLRTSALASGGFMDVDRFFLQSTKFSSVFGLGDCTNVPTSRTAAAAACEAHVVAANVLLALKKGPRKASSYFLSYSGYASCPLVCGKEECIMAEFNAFDATPMETFPFDQSVPRRSMYVAKKHILPVIYWQLMVKGLWNGPEPFRKLFAPLKRLTSSPPSSS